MHLEYFQLIDRIAEIDFAERVIRVEATVPVTSTIFEGHFPGHPLMPGVLLIEAMAQTSGWLIIGLLGFQRMPFLAGVKEAKLRQFVTPGTPLSLEAAIEHDGSGYTITRAKIKSEGKSVCDATLTFRVVPFPTADFRAQMVETAKRLKYPAEIPANG